MRLNTALEGGGKFSTARGAMSCARPTIDSKPFYISFTRLNASSHQGIRSRSHLSNYKTTGYWAPLPHAICNSRKALLVTMTHGFQQQYEALMLKANDYHKKALWQEKLRVLQDALAVCDEADFSDVEQRRQSLCFDVAGIWRRLGQYSRAEETLKPLAVLPSATSAFKASVLGGYQVTRVQHFYGT